MKRKLICGLLLAVLAAQSSCTIVDGGVIGYLTGRTPETEENAPEEPVYSEPARGRLVADLSWANANAPDFHVSNETELVSAAYWLNTQNDDSGAAVITLEDDIDLSGILWEPIGSGDAAFIGEINGAGHTISGLTIEGETGNCGLVGTAHSLYVHDISVRDAAVTGNSCTGIVCGECYTSKTWHDIYVSGQIHTGAGSDYGAIGGRTPNVKFRDCESDVTVNDEEFPYFTWQQYREDNNTHEEDFTLTLRDDGYIERTEGEPHHNLQWVVLRNGERVFGRGCDDEYSMYPHEYELVGSDPGIYSIYLESFYSGNYLRCSNIVEYELVPEYWAAYGNDYPLYTDTPYCIGFNKDKPDVIECLSQPDGTDEPDKLYWVVLADGEEAVRKETGGENSVRFSRLISDTDMAEGRAVYHIFLAGEENGKLFRVSDVLEQILNYTDTSGLIQNSDDSSQPATVFADGIPTDDDPSTYTVSLAADDLSNEPDFLADMTITDKDGNTWHAEVPGDHPAYSYGIGEPDENGFHIVTDLSGAMICIDNNGNYTKNDNVMWVVMVNGEQLLTDRYYINDNIRHQGEYPMFRYLSASEAVYSVFVAVPDSGGMKRLSNVLEFKVVK